MMDLIQFLDNIRPAYSGLQWPIVTVWNPTNMSGPDCLSQSHNLTISHLWLSDCIAGSEGPGRLDHDHLMSGLYNQVAAGQRPESASSASPPSNHPAHFPSFPSTSGGAGMLVVPQPINASKVSPVGFYDLVFTSLYYSDGSHGRGCWSWLLSSSYQWRSQEIPMQNVSTGRNLLLSSLSQF